MMEGFRNFMTDVIKSDLYQRFSLANNDLVVRGNHKRLFDEFRKAHWHYLDFHCPQPGASNTSKLQMGKPIAFEDFCEEMIRFSKWKYLHGQWRQLYDDWRRKTAQAVRCGAIVIDDTFSYVLVVKGFFRDGYQFPAGKKDDDDEPYETCATREVLEETGLDISNLIRPSLFLERSVFNCLRRYFLIVGVSSDQALRPSTRNEIKEILWMKIDNIPDDIECARHNGQIPREYFLCMPWAKQVKLFCQHLRNGSLPFQALSLSESGVGATETSHQSALTKRGSPKKNDSPVKKHSDIVCVDTNLKSSHKETRSFPEAKPSLRTPNCKKNGTVSPKGNETLSSVEKKSARKRNNRRRQRITSDSINNSMSDTSVETKSSTKSHQRGKTELKDYKTDNVISHSDSGYSDHSDQNNSYPDKFDLLKYKPFSTPGDFDSLMSKAILALSQIQVEVAPCTA